MAAIQRSKMIGAIKIYRELAGAGLREAKLYLRLPPGGSSSETP
jgi:ribosomal protein L7/L12